MWLPNSAMILWRKSKKFSIINPLHLIVFDKRSQTSIVENNQIYLSSSITDVVIKDYVKRLAVNPDKEADVLTPREREILQSIAEGLPTKDIASRLCISLKTVDTHRRNIMEKLNIRSVAELTKYAIREGLTSV